MKRTFLVFPDGWPGVALVVLRISLVFFLISIPAGRIEASSLPAISLYALALALGVGLRTRALASVVFVVALGLAASTGKLPPLACLAHALDAVVLAMTGPGAYSIDARLFGRQTVHLKP